ncbi:hypothetical protein C8J56DRAFT_1165202 [Mycena floridula]|nr:hypothetical protein C8J56DRAFT_1165202 [Mycena floridula]
MEFQPSLEPFPDLPSELVMLIIEFLLDIMPSKAVKLVGLSRNIISIVERAIYRSIIFDNQIKIQRFVRLIESGHRPIAFYQQNVQSICITTAVRLQHLLAILLACSNVQSLASVGYVDDLDELNQTRTETLFSCSTPSILACRLDWALDDPSDMENHRFTKPLFQLVTHLTLFDSHALLDEPEFDSTILRCMQHLTHLCLICPESTPLLASRLILADALVVCIISTINPASGLALSEIDPRIVFNALLADDVNPGPHILRLRHDISSLDHFTKQRRAGELDIWEEAEAMVAFQRAIRAQIVC